MPGVLHQASPALVIVRRLMRFIYMLLLLLVIVFGVSFGVLNHGYVRIDYYFHSSDIRLPILLALTLAIGVLLGWLVLLPTLMSLRFKHMQLRRTVRKYTKNLPKSEVGD
jgi:uncharacterized membrane protein YciS (DUF1049 family)